MKRIFNIIALLIFLSSCDKSPSEQQANNFIKYFGSGYESKGNSVITLPDGSYVFTGYDKISTSDFQVVAARINRFGNIIWYTTWGKNQYNEIGKKILPLLDNEENVTGYLIAGTTQQSGSLYTHSFLMKIDASGSQDSVWYHEFGIANFNLIINDFTVSTDRGTIYIAGETDQEGSNDYYIARLDANGENSTSRIRGDGATSETFNRIFLNASGCPFLVGTKNSQITITEYSQAFTLPLYSVPVNSNINQSFHDALYYENELIILYNESDNYNIIKLDASLNTVWQTTLSAAMDGGAMTRKTDETIMITGVNGTDVSFYLLDDLGSSTNVYSGLEEFKIISGDLNSMNKTNDKGLIMVGATPSTYGTMVQLIKTDRDLYLLKP